MVLTQLIRHEIEGKPAQRRLVSAILAGTNIAVPPGKDVGGVHVNVSGAGILKTAPHKAEAVKFLEWLSSPEAQGQFAEANHEYPVNPAVSASSFVQSWGKFDATLINMAKAGELQEKAIKLMDRVGYN